MTVASTARGCAPRLSASAVLAFSAPAAAMGALAVAFSVYLPQYYASHLGLGAAAVADVFFIVRAIDILFDPAIGMAMDRTRTRFGRYRAWLMLGAPVFMAATYMAFMAKPGVGAPYLIAALLAVYVGQSIINLSQTAWGAVLAPRYDDRSRLFSAISFLGLIGAAVLLLLPALTKANSGADPRLMHAMGWLMIIAAPAGIAWASARVAEPLAADQGRPASLADYWAVLKRPEVIRLMAADLCLELGPNGMAAIYLYFFESSRGFSAGQASLLLFIYIVAGLPGALGLAWLAVRFGKHRTLIGCTVVFSSCLIGQIFLPSGQFWIAAPPMAAMGAAAISFIILVRAMVADVGDQVRLETGKQRIGLLFALVTLTQKLASALSIILTFRLLPVIGFDTREGALHSPQTLRGLEILFLLGPTGFVLAGGACFIGWRLDARRHGNIRAALEARDGAQ